MSDPRLPAAPPHGPPVATTSALVQAAAADGLGGALDGVGVAVGDGLAVTDGLGVTGLPHATMATAASRASAIVDRIIHLRPCWVSHDRTGQQRIRRAVATTPSRFGHVLVVGPALAALGGWLPGVLRVAKLALRQLVKPLLLAAEHLELVFALLRFLGGGVEGPGLAGVRTRFSPKEST
jgi:hypothetical protein